MSQPSHIAFILDGNGRWAKKRGLPRNLGHREGVKALKATLENLCELNIPYASFFMFSTDNWKREKEEVDGLMALCEEYFSKQSDFFAKNGIQVSIFGDKTKFPKKIQSLMTSLEEKTRSNSRLHAGFCLNYGGREDILQAVNKLLASGKTSVTMKDISDNLSTRNFPDPDLLIRTSGEERLSNFMLFQLAYTELYFPKCYWPDFNEKELIKSLKAYSKRNRRFGGN